MNSSQSSSGSASSWGDTVGEDSTVVHKTNSSNTGDSCTWYANAGCKRPRTCYDCLNAQVSSGECAIMPNGMCVNLADYSNYLNQQQEFGNYYKYYASSQYTYCSADDSACSACSSKWVSDYTSTGSIDSTYCTGLDGCLCLARCELPDWQASITTQQCTGSASGTSLTTSTSTASRIGFALAVGVAFGVLLGLWGIKLLYRGRRRDRNPSVPGVYEFRTVRRHPQGPQLALTGWKALREKLIMMEQAAIGGDAVNMQEESLEDGGGVYYPASLNDFVQQTRDSARSH